MAIELIYLLSGMGVGLVITAGILAYCILKRNWQLGSQPSEESITYGENVKGCSFESS